MSDDGYVRRQIKTSDCRHDHTPDKRGERTDKWAKEPISVKWSSWHGKWVVKDGNDRLYYARQRGDKYIEAWVKT